MREKGVTLKLCPYYCLSSLLLNTILLNNIVKYVHKMMLKKKYVLYMYIKINKIDSF